MPLYTAIIAALGAFLFWYVFLRQSQQQNGLANQQGDRGGIPAQVASPVALINDPVSATATFLIALAAAENQLDDKAEALIKSEITRVMGVEKVNDLYDFSRHAAEQVTDPSNLMIRFARIWVSDLGPDERQDIYEMALKVVHLRGEPTDLQAVCLKQLASRLGLSTT